MVSVFSVLLFLEQLLLLVGGLNAAPALGRFAKGEYETSAQDATWGARVAFLVSLDTKGLS